MIEKPQTEETRRYEMLVGGEWVEARSGKTFESVNPYTGRVWATAPEAGEEDGDRAVRAAREAFDEGPWGRMTGTERARLMRRLAELIAENAESLAVFETTDNGKLLREMGGQMKASTMPRAIAAKPVTIGTNRFPAKKPRYCGSWMRKNRLNRYPAMMPTRMPPKTLVSTVFWPRISLVSTPRAWATTPRGGRCSSWARLR